MPVTLVTLVTLWRCDDRICKLYAYRARTRYAWNFNYFNVTNVTNVTTKPKREGNEVYSSKPTKRKLKAHEEEARPKRQLTYYHEKPLKGKWPPE